jgi:hypothetical protein
MTYNKYNGKYVPCGPILPPYRKRKEDWYYAFFYDLGYVTVTESEFKELKNKYKLKRIIFVADAYKVSRND